MTLTLLGAGSVLRPHPVMVVEAEGPAVARGDELSAAEQPKNGGAFWASDVLIFEM